MATSKKLPTATSTRAQFSFYRPHDRYATSWKNEVVDPITGEITNPPSMTKQQHLAECDINNIIKSYQITGQIRHISSKAAMGSYEDLPAAPDFQDAMNMVIQAEASFATLPSHVRARFGNDPAQFLTFIGDPTNKEEVYKLGLAQRPKTTPPEPSEAPPATPSSPQNKNEN